MAVQYVDVGIEPIVYATSWTILSMQAWSHLALISWVGGIRNTREKTGKILGLPLGWPWVVHMAQLFKCWRDMINLSVPSILFRLSQMVCPVYEGIYIVIGCFYPILLLHRVHILSLLLLWIRSIQSTLPTPHFSLCTSICTEMCVCCIVI